MNTTTNIRLWLRIRGLRGAVSAAIFLSFVNFWYGSTLAPVPAQIFTDIPGVPILGLGTWIFGLTFVGVSFPGEYWFDSGRGGLGVVSVWLGLITFGFVLPTLASGSNEIGWVGVRNALLWSATALGLRRFLNRAETAVALVFIGVTVFTLGWSSSGVPHEWALPLHPASSTIAAIVSLVLLGMNSVWLVAHSSNKKGSPDSSVGYLPGSAGR